MSKVTMKKGRTSTKASSKKKSKKSKETEDPSSKKVSEETEQQTERAEGKGESDSGNMEEVWDLVRVIPDAESFTCSTEDCSKKAVAAWASSLEPEAPWYGCESCQRRSSADGQKGPYQATRKKARTKSTSKDSSDDDHDKTAPVADKEDDASDDADKDESKTEAPSSPSDGHSDGNDESCSVTKPCDDIDHATTAHACATIEATPAKSTGVAEKSTGAEANSSTDGDSNAKEQIDVEATTADADDAEEREGEGYNLIKVLPVESITSNAPVLCQVCEENAVPAFGIYRGEKLQDVWYYCLDCQDNDFDGWPEKASDFPSGVIPSVEHENITRKICCAQGSDPSRINPELRPKIALAASHSPMPAGSVNKDPQLTPVPSTQTQGKSSKKKKPAAITPAPSDPYNIPTCTTQDKEKKKKNQTKSCADKTLAKWQAEADKVARPGEKNKIVVGKPDCKKLLFEHLRDSFACKSVNSVYEELKRVVPALLVKSCLDDMAELNKEPVFMSDDEEDDEPPKPSAAKPKSDDPYSGSLRFKGGRTAMNSVYYVDYSKLPNGGNFDAEAYNEVYGKYSSLAIEETTMKMECNTLTTEATKLESEPTNEEAASQLAAISVELEKLQSEEEEARKNCGSEEYKMKLKKRIREMAAECRKRKRVVDEFLIVMEDATEGTISKKKCLNGDGQIEMESDEMIVAQAKEAHARKKQRLSGGKAHFKKPGATGLSAQKDSLADPNFVGITFDSQGKVKREYVAED